MQTNAELLRTLLDITTDNIYVNNPCQVVRVNGNFVDVKMFINDEDEDCVLYNVPIQRPETQRAYIYLGIKQGDSGTLKFFDRSTEGYLQGDYDYNSDERQHDVNDRAFELGFVPNKEAFIYPTYNNEKDIEIAIGLKNKSINIIFTDDGIIMNGNVSITGNLTVSGEITGGTSSIKLTKHIHEDSQGGNTTNPTGNAT